MKPTSTVEVVALFQVEADFDRALSALTDAGFAADRISLLASCDAVESKLGSRYARVADLEDLSEAPRVAYVPTGETDQCQHTVVGALTFVAAAFGLMLASSGGLAAMIVAATAAGGTVGVGRRGVEMAGRSGPFAAPRGTTGHVADCCCGFAQTPPKRRTRPRPYWNAKAVRTCTATASNERIRTNRRTKNHEESEGGRHRGRIAVGGLYALSQIRRATDDFLVVDHGPLGTTCARVGCMPSKVLIQVAEDYHRREALAGEGIVGGEGLHVDPVAVMAHVRKLRDGFVGHIVPRTEAMGEKLVRGTARFVGPNAIEVDGERIEAERFILAVGSRPVVPESWKALGDRMMTTDSLFEQETLPRSIGVIGLGVIGLEMGQALSRLGVAVTGVHKHDTVCGISDPAVRDFMVSALADEFPLWLGQVPELSATANGVRIQVGERETEVDRVLVSLGRRSNLDRLDLGAAGIEVNSRGIPAFDPQTGRIEGHPIFVAGDAGDERLLLHEAGDEGRIAGVNALRDDVPRRFARKPRFDIVFSDPNVAAVGGRLVGTGRT